MRVKKSSSKVTPSILLTASQEMHFHFMRSTFPIFILLSSASSIASYSSNESLLQPSAPLHSAPVNSSISLTFNSDLIANVKEDDDIVTHTERTADEDDEAVIYEEQETDSSFELNDGSSMRFPLYLRFSATAICLILLAIGCPGNLLVPYVVMKTKELRNSTNIFLMNLSLSDLMILLISSPTILIELHSQPETWFLGSFMCKCKYLSFPPLSLARLPVTPDS